MYNDSDKHRSRIKIISSILRYINDIGKAKKTHILYATNLNTRSLEKFLTFLLKIHAIEKVKTANGIRYQITSRGNRILSMIDNLEHTMKENGYMEYRVQQGDVIRDLNKRVEPLLGDKITEIRTLRIKGRTGNNYRVQIAIGRREEYILVVMSEEEFICRDSAILCRILVYILDTDYKLIIYLDREVKTPIQKITSMLNDILSPINATDRYIIVNT